MFLWRCSSSRARRSALAPPASVVGRGSFVLLSLLLIGCTQSEQAESPPPAPPGSANPMTAPGPPGAPGTSGTPMATPGGTAGGEDASSAAANAHPALAKKVKDLEEKQASSPSDQTKKQLIAATYEYGHTVMSDPNLPPRVKYRAALAQFRRVLALDPSHTKAAEDKKMIEDIYRQMGRPVPE